MESLFKKRQRFNQGGVPDQLAYGADLERSIKKRMKTKPLDAILKIGVALKAGKANELKENLARITTNLEEEQAGLKAFGTQLTEHQARMKTLRDKGNGDLVAGIKMNFLKEAGVEDVDAEGIERRYSSDIFSKINDIAKEKAENMLLKEKEYKRLRSTYDPNDPSEGIYAENLDDVSLFNKPYNEALYNIHLNQKSLGNNNLLDVITNKANKNDYNILEDGIAEEEKLNAIITATRQSRNDLEDYVVDPEFLQSLIQEDTGKQGSARMKDQAQTNIDDVVTKTRMWLQENDREYTRGDYFFQQSSTNAALARKNQEYDEDYQSFLDYSGYTDQQLKQIYWQATSIASTLEEENIKNLLIGSDSGGAYGEEDISNQYKASLAQILQDYNNNVDIMPEQIKRKVITGLQIKGYEEQQINSEQYFQGSQIVENRISNLPEEYLEKYSNLDGTAEIDFKLSVIADAKTYMKRYGLSQSEAYGFAIQNQKFGLAEGTNPITFIGYKIAGDDRFQSQPLLPIKDGKLHQDILQNYPKSFNLTESTFSQYLNTINKNQVYWYHADTLSNPTPKMWEDTQPIIIGQYRVEFRRTPDAEGNHFINITP